MGDGTPNYGMTREVTLAEVAKAVEKMKNVKATGSERFEWRHERVCVIQVLRCKCTDANDLERGDHASRVAG